MHVLYQIEAYIDLNDVEIEIFGLLLWFTIKPQVWLMIWHN